MSCTASGLVTVVMQFLGTEMFQAMLTTISFTTVQGIKTRRENYSVFIHQVPVIISLGVRPEGQRFLHVSSLGSRGRSPSHNFQGWKRGFRQFA